MDKPNVDNRNHFKKQSDIIWGQTNKMLKWFLSPKNNVCNYEIEASVIGKYLLGKPINQKAVDLYIKAMETFALQPSARDQKRMAVVLKHSFLMPYIDGGLALADGDSTIRTKIFVMLSILESIPGYSDYFLARNFSAWYFFKIIFAGIRGVFRSIVGYLLVKLI